MKTCPNISKNNILTHQHFIDTAPMRAAYMRLTALTLLMIEQQIFRGLLLHLRKVSKCVGEFTRAEWSNHQLSLKLDLLRSKTWRARVLKDLGGEAALARWDRRMARSELAAKPKPEPSTAETPIWRKTPERIAEEMRQKVHAIKCAKAAAHPNITRDPFRVDFEGQFRLAPVPRGQGARRSAEEVLATTPDYMERYAYNAVPVVKMTGYDAPVAVWPAEFRAAAMLEREMAFQDKCAEVTALYVFAPQTLMRDDKSGANAVLPNTGEGCDALPEHPT